ncbi:MAG: hypothetical protein KatS3mg036_0142 [Ignavibacterium sp.]|nr:MAG: hypothetical protein KatS3mg036_0142 [Ignavibacterium sp.]
MNLYFIHSLEKRLIFLLQLFEVEKVMYRELFEDSLKDGFLKARVDGEIKDIVKGMKLERYKVHNIEISC